MMQFLRFLAVSGLGVALDIALGWSLASGAGLPLWLAAALGFGAAAALNFGLHRVWTFASATAGRAAPQLGRYGVALGVTLAVRLGAVLLLQAVLGAKAGALAVLLPAVALSFGASYLMARLWVFQPGGQKGKAR